MHEIAESMKPYDNDMEDNRQPEDNFVTMLLLRINYFPAEK
jgi:hypothetical protein